MAVTRQILPPVALTIAGSDSGGGAGIQADLKTFHALGVHGTAAITAVTAQNTRGVKAMYQLEEQYVQYQIEAILDEFQIGAIKTGMLGNVNTTQLVAQQMQNRKSAWLVVDPVMIATSGAVLLAHDAMNILLQEIIPITDVFTPNLMEAQTLLGYSLHTAADFDRAGEAFINMGARAVLIKGGHTPGGDIIDRWYDTYGRMDIRHRRLPSEGHGTGCTLAAAITANLALGYPPRRATRHAVDYVHHALAHGYILDGSGLTLLRH